MIPNRVSNMMRRGFATLLMAMAPLFLLAGCFGDGIQSTIRPESDSARFIHKVYAMVTWIDLGILIVVTVLFLYAIIKYRVRKGQEDEIPEQVHGSALLETIWTIIPAVILIFIAVPTWEGIFRADSPPAERMVVTATGHQWWWEFKYGEQNIVTANEMWVPVNKTVEVITNSADVIHAFWVPRLVGKIDSMPDRNNSVWFTPEKESLYWGTCTEYCGTSHANMRFRVRVVSQSEFDDWIERMKQPPVAVSDDAKKGGELFVSKGCIACHKIAGVPMALGVAGPNLTDFKDRSSLAAGIRENTKENMILWLRETQKIKPGALMGVPTGEGPRKFKPIDMTEAEAGQIAEYLYSDPGTPQAEAAPAATDAPVAAMKAEDIMRAKICITCHVIPGIPEAVGTVGPTLVNFKSHAKFAGGTLDNTKENLRKWLDNPPAMKPGTLMPPLGLTGEELDILVEYIFEH